MNSEYGFSALGLFFLLDFLCLGLSHDGGSSLYKYGWKAFIPGSGIWHLIKGKK